MHLLLLVGCSDFRFVNAEQAKDEDPRELLRLYSMRAEMTSGPQISSRVVAREAAYSDVRRRLDLTTMTLSNFDSSGREQGKTNANRGRAYLADDRAARRSRNDVVLLGNVIHNSASSGTSASRVRVTTEEMIWDNAAELFRGSRPFNALMTQDGKKPSRMRGQRFEATKNMRRWIVAGGNVGADSLGDLRKLADRTSQDLETSVTQIEKDKAEREAARAAMANDAVVRVPEATAPNVALETGSTVTVPQVNAPKILDNPGVPYRHAITP